MEALPFHPEEVLSARETFRRLSALRRSVRQRAAVHGPTLYVVASNPTTEFQPVCELLPAGRQALLLAQDGRCYLCGELFTDDIRPTTEHVVPRARGGRNRGNILLACSPCNGRKADRMPTPGEMAYLARINEIIRPRHHRMMAREKRGRSTSVGEASA